MGTKDKSGKESGKQSAQATKEEQVADRNLERDRAAVSDYPPLHKAKLRENKVDPIPASRDSLDNHRP